jgi:hypothetical protein
VFKNLGGEKKSRCVQEYTPLPTPSTTAEIPSIFFTCKNSQAT